MRLIVALLTLVVAFTWFGIAGPPPAYAERRVVYLDDGFRCEIIYETDLAKGICRQPTDPWHTYYIVYLDRSSGHTIFRDRLYPDGGFDSDTLPMDYWPH
jgi:hypothetical protein